MQQPRPSLMHLRIHIHATLQSSSACRRLWKLLEMQPAEVNAYTSFLAMGADSIALINAIRQVETVFEVKVSIHRV